MWQLKPSLHIAVIFAVISAVGVAFRSASGAEPDLIAEASPILSEYCLDCHSGAAAEAKVDLDALLLEPRLSTQFRTWEKVVDVLREERMPPEDMPAPSDRERRIAADTVNDSLRTFAIRQAGDPGRVTMRRLTSAEYEYTIRELTGLKLDFSSILIGDAVGGEGFANVGDVQFLQESTLERYLEAAKLVASHALIGSGPLTFFESPGKTGCELSAIQRINGIYRQHGFRTAAGEGGEAFGLDRYPRAFFVAWQYLHRAELSMPGTTLNELSRKEGLSDRFVEHVWAVLQRRSPRFPLSEIAAAWRSLPAPAPGDDDLSERVRQECWRVAVGMRDWQKRLAGNTGDDEEAAVLASDRLRLTTDASFRAVIDWPEGSSHATVELVTAAAAGRNVENAVVIWRRPTVQFRGMTRRRSAPVPLLSLLPEDSPHRNLFGRQTVADHVGSTDLVVRGESQIRLEFELPPGVIRARLSVHAELHDASPQDSIVRCTVRDPSLVGDTAADTGEVSAILGQSNGPAFDEWKAGVLEFAEALPDVSHREPAPSDRDPIPPPFDNSYNHLERNEFHYTIKYHRDDRFLVDRVLDDATRERLRHAWNDLLASFDYHDTYLKFIARKFRRPELSAGTTALQSDVVASLPAEIRPIVERLVDDHADIESAMLEAEPRHVDQAVDFAKRAWRRPVSAGERRRLQSFYSRMREDEELEHADAIQALLVRILVSPQFLYRFERYASADGAVPLSQWELASRLSYFLWSSPPDDELLELAQRGELDNAEQLVRQAERMLRHPKARRFAVEFFGQWFGFYRFDKYRGIDLQRFSEFDGTLKRSMYEEAISFFQYIVQQDRPAEEILLADYSLWNDVLARHYDASFNQTTDLDSRIQLVRNTGSMNRGGLLALGVVHATTSAPLRTSAVKRGDWILRRVLGTPVPPPPPDAGSIPADDVSADGLTVRQRLVAHRQDAACVNCHSRMDPLGFAMENFDPIGRWRDYYRDGQPIDASGILRDGGSVEGFAGLRKYLQNQLPKFHRTLSSKLLGYALGRSEILSDRMLIEQMIADLKDRATLTTLAARIVTSPQFRTKRGYNPTTTELGIADGND